MCPQQKHWRFSISWWWRHEMGTLSALLALCEGNPQVVGEFPFQRTNRTNNAGLMIALVLASTNGRTHYWSAGDLRRLGSHCDVTVMLTQTNSTRCRKLLIHQGNTKGVTSISSQPTMAVTAEIIARMNNYMGSILWHTITQQCYNFNSGLATPRLTLGHGWVIQSYSLMWM